MDSKIKVLSLCDGMSGGLISFSEFYPLSKIEYHAVENDSSVIKLSDSNMEVIRWSNDVLTITEEQIKQNGPYDWVMFGSACQSVSVCGNGEGLNGKSGILIDCVRVLEWAMKYNPDLKFLIENVKMKSEFLKQFNKIIGYDPVLIDSHLTSAQNRERYYWTNFEITQPENRNIFLPDILEDEIKILKKSHPNLTFGMHEGTSFGWSKSTRYLNAKGKVQSKKEGSVSSFIEQRVSGTGKSNTLTTGWGCSNQSTATFIMLANGDWRNLSVRECARLQTIPEWVSFSAVSEAQAYKAIGNGWTIQTISHILKLGIEAKELKIRKKFLELL